MLCSPRSVSVTVHVRSIMQYVFQGRGRILNKRCRDQQKKIQIKGREKSR